MEEFLSIVEEQPSVKIKEERLRQFLSHTKVWDFVNISQQEYQSLPATDRYSILQNYYKKMTEKYSSAYKNILLFCFLFAV